jgi:hypothetical protein
MPSNPRYHSTRKPRRSKWQGVTEASAHIAEETLAADPLGIENVKPGGTPIAVQPIESKWVDKASQKRMAMRYIEGRIIESLEPIMDGVVDSAVGLKMVDPEDGRVYRRAPDHNFAKLALSYIGKPVEQVNITVNGKELDEASDDELALALAQEGITAEEIENAILDEE